MKKDFTKTSEEHLVSIIKSVEPNNWFEKVGDWFGDIGLTISGWFGNLNINSYLSNVDEYHRKILDKNNTTVKQLKSIFSKVRDDDVLYANKFQNEVKDELIKPIKTYICELTEIVNPTNGLFNANIINQKLLELTKILSENLKKLTSPSYATDDGVHFGGNQGSAYDRWTNGDKSQFRSIIKKYYPDLSDAQISNLLNEMNHEGCNFMALVNTVFAQYVGREDEFERIFGFPMYDENGYPNWDYLMIDFYCESGWYDGKTTGLSKKTSEEVWEKYMGSKGVHTDVVNINVTVDNFYEISQNGEIIIGISPLRLRNEHGKLVDKRDGGHAMVITDIVIINEKKMYKVSSWGDDYYIDPDDFDDSMRIEYQQVRY